MTSTSKTKPCHTCRRRRLRCDRSWPTCNKCAFTGQECLGYGKVFVWAQSNSNPQGSSRPWPISRTSSAEPNSFQIEGPAGLMLTGSPRAREMDERLSKPAIEPSGENGAMALTISIHDEHEENSTLRRHSLSRAGKIAWARVNKALDHAIAAPSEDMPDKAKSPHLPHRPYAGAVMLLNGLTDPVLQDLNPTSRYYLSHFATSVCKDLVPRDAPDNNPFRQLIPLTHRHPLLLEILVATSALHFSNVSRPVRPFVPGLEDPYTALARLRSQDQMSKRALVHALMAKQKAIGHLREVLETLDSAGSEVALAAVHFLIKFDLIDMDRHNEKGWQAHLEGANSILVFMTSRFSDFASTETLRDCLVAHCFMYHILGSTLASGAIASRIACHAIVLMQVMKRVEASSYLGCPPHILRIILDASRLSYESTQTGWDPMSAHRALSLIDQCLAFDISAWAGKLHVLQVPDIESRTHIAFAHRSAACLYLLQVLPTVRLVRPLDKDALVDDILEHLGQIHKGSPYIKTTSWPTFFAGAETRDSNKRSWAMSRLFDVWRACPWGYIFTAIEMLKATWEMQDSGTVSGADWLQDLKNMGFDSLIV